MKRGIFIIVKINKKRQEIIDFLEQIKNTDTSKFRIFSRIKEPHKSPNIILGKLGYDFNDLIKVVKNLSIEDFLRCELDTINNFFLMYIFLKDIEIYNIYIKLGIDENKVCVISFHETKLNENNNRPFKKKVKK